MRVGRMVVLRKADTPQQLYIYSFGVVQLTAVNLSELVAAFLV